MSVNGPPPTARNQGAPGIRLKCADVRISVPTGLQGKVTMRMIRTGCLCQRGGFAIALCVFLCCSGVQSLAAENLECPEIGPSRVPDLIGDTTGAGLFATENFIDLANEINEAISRLEISAPDISRADVQNVLIAAYCRVVAREPGLAAAEKWGLMRQFTGVLEREMAVDKIAVDKMLPGGPIIARIPLPPDVYRELQAQAEISHLTAAQLMAAILARAAGR